MENINIEMNVEMNEEAVKISMIEKNQERKLQNARQRKQIIDEKRNELAQKKTEMQETMEFIKYYQQMLISSFLEKADLLEEIELLISEVQYEEESAKDSIVNFMYPELLSEENLTKTLEQDNFAEIITSSTIDSFIEQLEELNKRLGQVRYDD